MKDRGWLVGAAVILLLLLIVAWGLSAIGLPRNPADELAPLATQVARPQANPTEDALEPKDRLALQRDLIQSAADSRIKTWTLIAQVIGAAVLAIGGYFTWRNLRIAQEGQITNRFTQAIGQLGAELKDGKRNLEVRLGGIYALERIARDSPRDHWTIMEVLTAYVRENARWTEPSSPDGVVSSPENVLPEQPREREEPPPLRTDIQAVLTVIGRRVRSNDRPEPAGLDLHGIDLRRVNLRGAHLEGVVLRGAHLERARLDDAHLEGATLSDADLQGANFTEAHLNGAFLWRAHLKEATLVDAHLEAADLRAAILDGANLSKAHLETAILRGAHLERANLTEAHLEAADLGGATLEEADVWGAHLERAKDLTPEQVSSARGHGSGALLPPKQTSTE